MHPRMSPFGVSCLVVALFLLVVCSTPGKCNNSNEGIKEFKELLTKYSEECHAKTKSNYAATMDMFYKGKDYMPGKCFVGCVMQKFGLMDQRGAILEDKIRTSVKEIPSEHAQELAREHLDECLLKARDRNQCQKAFRFADCFFRHARTKGKDRARS